MIDHAQCGRMEWQTDGQTDRKRDVIAVTLRLRFAARVNEDSLGGPKGVQYSIYQEPLAAIMYLHTSALSSLIFFLPVMLLCLLGSEFKLPTSGEAGREFFESVLTLESFLGSWSRSTSSRSSDTHSSKRLLTEFKNSWPCYKCTSWTINWYTQKTNKILLS